ncbi:MAG: ThuA domain-containing protein [Thermoguttaceae bacterium]|jgi:type 1 glutamine amidotransferase
MQSIVNLAVATAAILAVSGILSDRQARAAGPDEQAKAIEAAAPDTAPTKPAKPRKVLIYGTDPMGVNAFTILGKKTGAYETVVTRDIAIWQPEKLRQFDAIVMNNNHEGDLWLPAGWYRLPKDKQEAAKAQEPVLRKNFLDFVAGGKGLVGIHGAAWAIGEHKDYVELLGGQGWGVSAARFSLLAEDPTHPLCAALGGRNYELFDELYIPHPPTFSRDCVHVLLRIDTGRTQDPGLAPPGNYAVSWIRRHGQGRVFYCSLGHFGSTYSNPVVLRHWLAGIQYALGDLKADDSPSGLLPSQSTTVLAEEKPPKPQSEGDETGFVSLFQGNDLSGWDGNGKHWSVQDSAITGRTTQESRDPPLGRGALVPISQGALPASMLAWKGGKAKDFELRLRFRVSGGFGAICFRAVAVDEQLTGALAEIGNERPGGHWMLAGRLVPDSATEAAIEVGQSVAINRAGAWTTARYLGNPNTLIKVYRPNQWNDGTIVAQGGHVVLKLNGVLVCEVQDERAAHARAGLLALAMCPQQVMQIQFKDIRLKKIE